MINNHKIVTAVSVVTALALVGGGIYVVRNVNEKPPVVVEQMTRSSATASPVASPEPPQVITTFKGIDAVHWGRGGARIIQGADGPVLQFDADFEVAQGPDLFVYLSPNAAGDSLGAYASLGKLQANGGEQSYTLPADYARYKTVVIWCRAFGVTFATADITPRS